jgi:uncharacterized protein
MNVEDIIQHLNLEKHPTEGGYFSETYRSKETIKDYKGSERSVSTAIFYLLTNETDAFSEMHRLQTDEIFHFYLGDPVEMLHLYPDGTGKKIIFGNDLANGMQPQVIVPANVWQGARLIEGGRFCLMGTTMAPGFEYSEYQSGSQKELSKRFPEYKKIIAELTRKP